jgi:hypothetical protein
MNFLKDISLQEGDYIVCVTKSWSKYTYGKKYKVNSYKIQISLIVDVLDDDRYRRLPCYYGVNGNYFITLTEWREMQIGHVIEF